MVIMIGYNDNDEERPEVEKGGRLITVWLH